MAGFKWTAPPQDVWPPGAAAYAAAVCRGVYGVMQRWEPEIENWMKANKLWVDRTANAVQTLYTEVVPPSPAEVIDEIAMIMAHGVEYGAFLEGFDPRFSFSPTRQGQKYAIVGPALDRFGPLIWADIVRMLS